MFDRRLQAALLLALLALAAPGVRASDTSTVVVLFSGTSLIPQAAAFADGLRDALRQSRPVNVEGQHLETSSLGGEAHEQALLQQLTARNRGRSVPVLVAFGLPASMFARRSAQDVWPGARIVHVLTEGDDVTGIGARDLTVMRPVTYRATVERALTLFPDAKVVHVIAGGSPLDQRWLRKALDDLAPLRGRVRFEQIAGLAWNDVLARVSLMPSNSFALAITFFADAEGRSFISRDAIVEIAKTANRPLFVPSALALGSGALGAFGADFSETGRQTAQHVVRLLAQPDMPSPGRIAGPPPAWTFDAEQMQHWNVAESALPAGSTVVNRRATVWQQYRWLILIASLLVVGESAIISALLVQRAKRRRAEEEAVVRQRELVHMGRVAILGELTGAIAHELNQPLTVILGNAEAARRILNRGGVDLDTVRDAVEDTLKAGERAVELIDHLRTMLKKREFKPEAVDVNDLMIEAIALTQRELNARHVSLVTRLTPGLPASHGDRVQLQQVVLNLMLNACQAMEGNDHTDRTITMSTSLTDDGSIGMAVSDRGAGIPPNRLDTIFDSFVSTKPDGLGLGLSICRSIVNAHGGRLWVINNPDRGATFHVSLKPHVQTGVTAA